MTMKNYTDHVSTKETPQAEKIPGSTQVPNNAGGYGWAVDDWTRLRRFLILGSDGGTYYQDARPLTKENAEAVIRCIKVDGARTIAEIISVSLKGLAPKNDPAIFALAAASALGDAPTRQSALAAMPDVCRIGTHLFAFAEARQAFGGWGRGMRRAVQNWYLQRSTDQLALQLAKYQSRNGWSHRDLLRLAHPVVKDDEQKNALLGWAVGKAEPAATGHALVTGMSEASAPGVDKRRVVQLITDLNLTREMVATEYLADPDVQWALMQKQGLTALIRNLGNYSKSGLLKPLSEAAKFVAARLSDEQALRKARVHPFMVLLAARTYASGHGVRGKGTWTTTPAVIDALDNAFYAAFENVEPTGKNFLLGIDISGSMGWKSGDGMTSAEAAAAMAMTTLRTEANCYAHGFATTFVDLKLSPKMRLPEVMERTSAHTMGGTDCALPMIHALKHKLEVDTFVVYTDNETWFGKIHPKQALDEYRQKMGRPARLVTCAFTAGEFTIADPADAGMLDCVGRDASLPQILRSFALGEV